MTAEYLGQRLNQRPIAVFPAYIQIMGSVTGGVILSQLMYWFSRAEDGEFYKTDSKLREETRTSKWEVKAAKTIIKSRVPYIKIKHSMKHNATVYRINWEFWQHVMESSSFPGVKRGWSETDRRVKVESRKPTDGRSETDRLSSSLREESIKKSKERLSHGARESVISSKEIWHTLSLQLFKIVSHSRQVNRTSQPAQWADHIRKIHEVDGIPLEEIKTVLKWYEKIVIEEGGIHHLNRIYVAVAESGKTFREKFFKIQSAMKRRQPEEEKPLHYKITKRIIKRASDDEE